MLERLKAFLEHLRYVRNYSPETLRAYETDLRQLAAFLTEGGHGTDVRKIDPPLIRAFLASEHARETTRATMARKLSSIRSFWDWMRREGQVKENPARDVLSQSLELEARFDGSTQGLLPGMVGTAVFPDRPKP